jgi:WD40 repeat protein
VNALAMDPWARFVVTASSDGTARVWDLSSARTVHTLKAGCREQGGVLAVALSPCTRFAILGCADGAARMYDVISGQCMGVMGGAAGWVTAARFLPDGKSALTAGHDGVVRCVRVCD